MSAKPVPSRSARKGLNNIRRTVILENDAGSMMVVSLHTWGGGAVGAYLDPGGDPALSYNTFHDPRDGVRWLDALLKELTGRRGWRKVFDGRPLSDGQATTPSGLLSVSVSGADPEPAGTTAEELGAEVGEPQTVLIIREGMLGSLSVQDHAGGSLINRTVHRDGNWLMTVPQFFPRREDAAAEFSRSRDALREKGWSEFYAGSPLRG